MMNLIEMVNDTARKNTIRKALSTSIYKAMCTDFGEEKVRLLEYPITVMPEGDNKGTNFSKGTVFVCVGEVVNAEGATVDAVAAINVTCKAWDTKTSKSNVTTYAINFDDIDEAIAYAREKKRKEGKRKEE